VNTNANMTTLSSSHINNQLHYYPKKKKPSKLNGSIEENVLFLNSMELNRNSVAGMKSNKRGSISLCKGLSHKTN